MARGDIIAEVFEYVRNHRGETVKLDDLRRATGLNTVQCQQSIRDISRKRLWPISTLIAGRWWRLGVSETQLDPVVYPGLTPGTGHPTPEPESEFGRPESTMSNWKGAPHKPEDEPLELPKREAVIDRIEQFNKTEPPPSKALLLRAPDPEPDPAPPRRVRAEIVRKPVTEDQSNHLFEHMGARTGGKLLLRRDDGLLYEATLEQL